MTEDRFAFGLRFRSELELPELAPFDADGEPDVTIRLGAVPAALPGSTPVGRLAHALPGDFLVDVPKVARFRVLAGREIIADIAPGATPAEVRAYLLGTVAAAAIYQRGMLPLHANSVRCGDDGFAFAGPTGSGKSTLAAYFLDRGYPVLADDVTVVSPCEAGPAAAWPGVRRIKLCADAFAAFGRDTAGLERVPGVAREKFVLPNPRMESREPAAFTRLYVLGRAPQGEAGAFRRLNGRDALAAFLGNIYRPNICAGMGLKGPAMVAAAQALRHAQVFLFRRRWGFDAFAEEAVRLEAHMRTDLAELGE
ncbi:MAG TPA: hypothetical protein VHW60_13760 [Caulobacteraceae bacterium]|nr:hypothetical protein [Caulobacteraceae bacterium]